MNAHSYGINQQSPLSVCPKCKERTLHVQGMSGRDDYGELEGERSACENPKCDYTDEWCGRC